MNLNPLQISRICGRRRLERARCCRDATLPAVMLRECDDYKVELVPKTTTQEEDRVVIRGPGKL